MIQKGPLMAGIATCFLWVDFINLNQKSTATYLEPPSVVSLGLAAQLAVPSGKGRLQRLLKKSGPFLCSVWLLPIRRCRHIFLSVHEGPTGREARLYKDYEDVRGSLFN